jgi:hypothetical protein
MGGAVAACAPRRYQGGVRRAVYGSVMGWAGHSVGNTPAVLNPLDADRSAHPPHGYPAVITTGERALGF